ncbi:MAG TPA: MaoC/PaaZ C-terminal domain-containing protein [Acidimicrobiales bacterium]|nr:MaoC/PaaZ C-terminal domain-containing protein [Acidimicrobiales bacterium]
MSGPGVVLGTRVGPFAGCLDADLVRRWAAATADPCTRAQAGEAVPAVAVVTQIWDAQNAARAALVPQELQAAAASGVHGEHDVVLHRPIVPGEALRTWVEGHGSRPAGRNAVVTLRYVTVDAGDEVVAEQWWSTVYLGTTCDPAGEPAPDHAFPEDARARPAGAYGVAVDAGMARRYAEVSGDWSPHHFEVAAARRSGSDRPFLHGLCTMALCAQGVVELVAGGDPERVRRVAVRFATPMPVGERLELRLYDAGPRGYAFEAVCGSATVVSHGRAELR